MKLASGEKAELLATLESRFEANTGRHPGVSWSDVLVRLEAAPKKLRTLFEMERTGGEPDVVGHDPDRDEYLFFDCSPESPTGRRSVCYDREARLARKKHPPASSAQEMAAVMGATLLDPDQYRLLQELGAFDTKTSSWLATPSEIRTLGGAIFGDRRYETVFVYHNGADSYYAARGFRCCVRL